jgi:hypothetical protein
MIASRSQDLGLFHVVVVSSTVRPSRWGQDEVPASGARPAGRSWLVGEDELRVVDEGEATASRWRWPPDRRCGVTTLAELEARWALGRAYRRRSSGEVDDLGDREFGYV